MQNDQQLMKIFDSHKIHHDLVYQPFRNIESENNMALDTTENEY